MATRTEDGENRQCLLVMRHGLRIDHVDTDWSSTSTRPWDPPLASQGLEKTDNLVEDLRAFDVTKIVASPFLRCVQTAAAVLDGLHLPQNALEYDWQICEVLTRNALAGSQWDPPALPIDAWMWACKQSGAAKSTEPPSTQTACDSTALTQQVAQERHECCAGAGQQPDAALLGARPVELAPGTIIHGPAPAFPETIEAVHARYTAALQAIADRHAGHNVLVVTHGEAVNRSVTRLMPWAVVFEVQPCGFTVAWRDRGADGSWDDGWVLAEQDSRRGVAWMA